MQISLQLKTLPSWNWFLKKDLQLKNYVFKINIDKTKGLGRCITHVKLAPSAKKFAQPYFKLENEKSWEFSPFSPPPPPIFDDHLSSNIG